MAGGIDLFFVSCLLSHDSCILFIFFVVNAEVFFWISIHNDFSESRYCYLIMAWRFNTRNYTKRNQNLECWNQESSWVWLGLGLGWILQDSKFFLFFPCFIFIWSFPNLVFLSKNKLFPRFIPKLNVFFCLECWHHHIMRVFFRVELLLVYDSWRCSASMLLRKYKEMNENLEYLELEISWGLSYIPSFCIFPLFCCIWLFPKCRVSCWEQDWKCGYGLGFTQFHLWFEYVFSYNVCTIA